MLIGHLRNGQECPRAFVVRRNSSLRADKLDSLVKERLAKHKWLSGGIYFIDHLPRTGSGKVIKRALPNPDNRVAAKL